MSDIPTILLVDNEPEAALFFRRACLNAGVEVALTVFEKGADAVNYLQQTDGSQRRPCLVLLDLHMPQMDGFEVLKWIKSRPELDGLPVVILSSSASEQSRARCELLGAAEFIQKPAAYEDLVLLAQRIGSTWLQDH